MAAEEVIELSVEETNKLRAELGLKPLQEKGAPPSTSATTTAAAADADADAASSNANNGNNEEVLEMSVSETNKLRAQLGLPPLRNSSSKETAIHDVDLKEKQRLEDEARMEEQELLAEDVERGIESTFTAKSLGADGESDAKSWAAKLRQSKSSSAVAAAAKTKKKAKKPSKSKTVDKYDESDLNGMAVSHAASELQAGSTTVMTLADAPLLESNEHNAHIVTGLNEDANTPQLENVNLAEAAKQSDGLKKKRQLEMGMGRAGGYAGYDDDEFEELGGTGVASRANRTMGDGSAGPKAAKSGRGFQIGDTNLNNARNDDESDLFAMESGRAISLEPVQMDVQASDFMTEQEDLDLRGKPKKEKRTNKRDKFDKKKKKKDKKEKRKHRRQQEDDEESDEEPTQPPTAASKTLLQELEESAADNDNSNGTTSRKRNRDDDKGDQEEAPTLVPVASLLSKAAKKKGDKRAKYEAVMEKGNVRTQQAFAPAKEEEQEEEILLDDEPDDAFLNAALAKARRLKKLRGMIGDPAATGAEAVAAAVQSMPDAAPSSSTRAAGGITFSVDDTREFTRALQAKSEQQTRKQNKLAATKKEAPSNTITTVKKIKEEPKAETVTQDAMEVDAGDDNADMAEMAKEIKDDDSNFAGLHGTTGSTVSVGRGLAGVLNLFQQTGELTRKNAGKEELRGRANDERNYEDYEKMDLKKVVRIDDRHATEKDREIASREIKLEYRDKHGRLLTRKEAYRDLCYQFHGHGSSKKNEEKKLRQMEREQAEARLAQQQAGGGPGMLGALKATQKATGKAFVVHKT